MTSTQVIRDIFQNGLDANFLQQLRNMYQHNVTGGAFSGLEEDYTTGITALKSTLSSDMEKKLNKYEHICSELWEYSSRYGFIAGLSCGFKQYFTDDQDADGGFLKTVWNEIAVIPQMMQHINYYTNIEQQNMLAREIEAAIDVATYYHFVSVQCAWDQRSYSASIDGFYLGYRSAIAVLGVINPQSFPHLKMESKLLSMEHQLGFIKSYDEIERGAARYLLL